jgi:probable phosphoglycerate mutase
MAVKLEVSIHPGLRERAYGILEGKTWDEINRDYPEAARRLVHDPVYVIPGGESLVQFRDRVTAALQEIVAASHGRAFAVVTHGGVLGIMYRVAMRMALDAPRSYRTVNAGVNHFRSTSGCWQLVRWGDADHLGSARGLDDL